MPSKMTGQQPEKPIPCHGGSETHAGNKTKQTPPAASMDTQQTALANRILPRRKCPQGSACHRHASVCHKTALRFARRTSTEVQT